MIWLQKFLHPTVLVIRDGQTTCAKGKISSRCLSDLDEVLAQQRVTEGSISIDGAQRYHFSSTIPPEIQQRLRNVF